MWKLGYRCITIRILIPFFLIEKDSRLVYNKPIPIISDTTVQARFFSENVNMYTLICDNKFIASNTNMCYVEVRIPSDVSVGDFFFVNIPESYDYCGSIFELCFYPFQKNEYYSDCFNVTNGGIRIIGEEPIVTESPQTVPPQTDPPQINPPEPIVQEPIISEPISTTVSTETTTVSETTTTTISETTTATSDTTITSEITTVETTLTATLQTTLEDTTTVITTTISKSEESKKNNLPLILAIIASIGVIGGIIGVIIKKSKRN